MNDRETSIPKSPLDEIMALMGADIGKASPWQRFFWFAMVWTTYLNISTILVVVIVTLFKRALHAS